MVALVLSRSSEWKRAILMLGQEHIWRHAGGVCLDGLSAGMSNNLTYWERQKGGGRTYHAIWGGGNPPKPVLEASKVGLVWSVPVSTKLNDRAWTNGGGG